MIVTHTFEPVFNRDSKVLILGTIPSPKSRELGFYYGHPQNSFWKVISAVLCTSVPKTILDKKKLLLDNNIALWDVLHSCEIDGAKDSSIKNPVANDFSVILSVSDIKAVFTTGKQATRLYGKYCTSHIPVFYLPSTSPANRISFEALISAYEVIRNFL